MAGRRDPVEAVVGIRPLPLETQVSEVGRAGVEVEWWGRVDRRGALLPVVALPAEPDGFVYPLVMHGQHVSPETFLEGLCAYTASSPSLPPSLTSELTRLEHQQQQQTPGVPVHDTALARPATTSERPDAASPYQASGSDTGHNRSTTAAPRPRSDGRGGGR